MLLRIDSTSSRGSPENSATCGSGIARDTAMNNARSMIRDGSIPLVKVAEFSGLSLDEVEKLKSSISL